MNVLRGNDKALACQAPFTLALVCLVQEDRVLLDSRLQIAFYLYHPTENIDIWQGLIFFKRIDMYVLKNLLIFFLNS